MKLKWNRIFPVLLLAFFLTACGTGEFSAQESFAATYPSQLLVGDVYVLKSHEKIDGNIVGFDTTLIIEEDASVFGDISLFGGESEISGRVAGDINLFGGTTHILKPAIITGTINKIANKMEIDPGAVITSEINTFTAPNRDLPESIEIPKEAENFLRPQTWVIFQIIRNLLLTFFNMLIIFLFKDQTLRVVNQMKKQPLVSWVVGLLSFIAAPLVALVFVITICLSPIGIIFLIALVITNLLGWTATSFFLGNRLIKWLKLEWREVVIVAAGSLLFGIFFTLIALIPFASLIASSLVSAIGCGSVVLYLLNNRK